MASIESDPLTAAPLDVLEIDGYLHRLLVPRLHSILRPFGFHSPTTHAQSMLLAVSICMMFADTPATLALGLKVKGNSRRRVLAYILLASIAPGLFQQLDEWCNRALLNQETENMSSIESRARSRKRYLAQRLTASLKMVNPLVQLTFLLSWWMAKTPSPTASMVAAGLTFSRTRIPRNLNVTYAHRRWIYELILRSVDQAWPFRSLDHLRTMINSMLSPVWALVDRAKWQKGEDRCALCYSQPVLVPCFTNCNHLYCYTCLWTALAKSASFYCRQCGHRVTKSSRSRASAMQQ
ncbi:hypothetical protein MHU86_3433 [Fragilaria crotonensis]|nr:hypothetical protein MHU86_3433 [Fragilaria crotonensis]